MGFSAASRLFHKRHATCLQRSWRGTARSPGRKSVRSATSCVTNIKASRTRSSGVWSRRTCRVCKPLWLSSVPTLKAGQADRLTPQRQPGIRRQLRRRHRQQPVAPEEEPLLAEPSSGSATIASSGMPRIARPPPKALLPIAINRVVTRPTRSNSGSDGISRRRPLGKPRRAR